MTKTADNTNPKKIGRPPAEEVRKNRVFKALESEWKQINKNAKTLKFANASDYIRETLIDIPKWFNTSCFIAILNKPFSQVVFEKDSTEKIVVKAESNKYTISHVISGIERAYIEVSNIEDIAKHLDQNGYKSEMLISKN